MLIYFQIGVALHITIRHAYYEDKYALLEEITKQFFYEMVPEQVRKAVLDSLVEHGDRGRLITIR